MMTWLFVAVIAVSVSLLAAHPFRNVAPRAACGYDSCHPIASDKLNVHMIPHSHDDLGWLKTVDQLYFGSRSNLQRAGVQYILDSVVAELQAHPDRRFIYVETAFFSRWWDEQTEEQRDIVRGLVNSGQLEITNGAWSMNDEAVAHYQSIIDNFAWGSKVLNDTLGECGRPTVGWQIDPFGHSREHASISARMGFDAIFFARLDFQDRRKRLADKTAEMIWRGSPDNLGDVADIFTHAFESAYSPPPGFCFDVNCSDDPMIDDPSSPEYNIPDRVQAFSDHVKNKATMYRSNNVLLTMGDDFNYQDANVWYKNLDKVIKYVNADPDSNMNVIYSTPACYLKAVNDEGLSWPEKSDDFFPYGTDPGAYWVGFFTAKPTMKYFERLGNNFLQVSKQLLTLAGSTEEDEAGVTELREAVGVMQHHDAITGTMKDFVAQDYYRILDVAIAASGESAEAAVNKLMGNTDAAVPVWNCLKLNISECALTEGSDNFVITVYNPLSWPTSAFIRVPVTSPVIQVLHPDGSILSSEIIDLPAAVLNIPGRDSAATSELVFRADSLPPLGFQSFYVALNSQTKERKPKQVKPEPRATTIGNEQVLVNIDDSGLTQSITINGIDVGLAQTFEYYIGKNKEGELMSNAYMLVPNGTSTVKLDITDFKVVRTPLVEEVHQEFGDWVSQVIRVYAGENLVEFEWLVGPIPDEDNIPKDIISRFATDLATDATFYTDSNGREILKRVRNFRPTWEIELTEPETVAANYYPIVSRLFVRDEAKGVEVAVLVDRAQGGGSIHDGEIELMLHRRLFRDDGFEPLNEVAYGTGLVVRGKHWLVAGPIVGEGTSFAVQQRQLQAAKFLKPWTFVSPSAGLSQQEWAAAYNVEFSGLTGSGLPPNVQILTLEPWTQNTLLLRLEHILEVNEDDELSQPATIDLTGLFAHFTINSAVETTLGGIQPIEELNRLQWNSEVRQARSLREYKAVDITAVTLNPMEIRTFIGAFCCGNCIL